MELYKMTFDPEYWKRSFCTKSGNVLGGMIPYTMLTAVVEREFDKMIKSIVDYESSSEDGLDDPTISKIEEDGVNNIRECMTNATIYCINNHCGYNIPNSIFASIFKNLFDDDAKSSRNLLVEERLTPVPQWMHDLSNKYDWDDPFMVLICRLHHALLLAEEGSEKIIERRICEKDKRIWFDGLDFGQNGNMSIWFYTPIEDTKPAQCNFNKRYICPNRSDYEKDHTIEYDEMLDHSPIIVKNHYISAGTQVDISDELCELFDINTCYRHAFAYDDETSIIYFGYKSN